MYFLHGLMAEQSVKTNIVKVLICALVNNRLTPPSVWSCRGRQPFVARGPIFLKKTFSRAAAIFKNCENEYKRHF